MNFSKPERRILRQIAGEAHEAEARQLLQRLDGRFQRWRDGALPNFDLIGEIHRFHDYDSRDMWKVYRTLDEVSLVARGVALGLIPRERVPGDLLARLSSSIEYFADRERDAQLEADEEEPPRSLNKS